MVIYIETQYPTESVNQMAGKFVERMASNPPPDFLTMRGPYVKAETGVGIQSITIFEVEDNKLAEGMMFCLETMVSYIGIPGYTYTIDVRTEVQEALKMIGME